MIFCSEKQEPVVFGKTIYEITQCENKSRAEKNHKITYGKSSKGKTLKNTKYFLQL